MTKHGMYGTPAYKSWQSMLARVRGRIHPQYYADKGIGVVSEWLSFAGFYAAMGERPAGTSLDRIDNSRGYEPGNCRWATQTEQVRNRSNTTRVTLDGVSRTLPEWSAMTGLTVSALRTRLNKGWGAEAVLYPHHLHTLKGKNSADRVNMLDSKVRSGLKREGQIRSMTGVPA